LISMAPPGSEKTRHSAALADIPILAMEVYQVPQLTEPWREFESPSLETEEVAAGGAALPSLVAWALKRNRRIHLCP
jgi:hypothetical protein